MSSSSSDSEKAREEDQGKEEIEKKMRTKR